MDQAPEQPGTAVAASSVPQAPAGNTPALEWSVNAWRQSPSRALVAVIGVGLIWGLISVLRLTPLTALVLGVTTFFFMAPGFWSSRCRVDHDGVARKRFLAWQRRSWSQIRRVRIDSRGLFVSPMLEAGLGDAARGLYLPVPTELPEHPRLMTELKQRLAAHGF